MECCRYRAEIAWQFRPLPFTKAAKHGIGKALQISQPAPVRRVPTARVTPNGTRLNVRGRRRTLWK